MDKYRIQDDAIALFDGGWRSCDAEELESDDADWAEDENDE